MRFLWKYWYLFAFSCFAAMVGFFVWSSPQPENFDPSAYEALAVEQPGSLQSTQMAKPPVPQSEAVARGERSLAGHEPEFVKKMPDSQKQEFYAQIDEIDRIEKEQNEMQETEVLDESSFGIVENQ